MHIINNNLHTTRLQYKNQNATTREGNIELRSVIKHRRKKKQKTEQKTKNPRVPYKNNQTTLLAFS